MNLNEKKINYFEKNKVSEKLFEKNNFIGKKAKTSKNLN